jgi:hypothetical protein
MTTTKIVYLIAVVVPFGLVALAAIALVHLLMRRHAEVVARAEAA